MDASMISEMKAVASHSISESCYRYERQLSNENAKIAEWLVKLTCNRRTWALACAFCICAA